MNRDLEQKVSNFPTKDKVDLLLAALGKKPVSIIAVSAKCVGGIRDDFLKEDLREMGLYCRISELYNYPRLMVIHKNIVVAKKQEDLEDFFNCFSFGYNPPPDEPLPEVLSKLEVRSKEIEHFQIGIKLGYPKTAVEAFCRSEDRFLSPVREIEMIVSKDNKEEIKVLEEWKNSWSKSFSRKLATKNDLMYSYKNELPPHQNKIPHFYIVGKVKRIKNETVPENYYKYCTTKK